MKLLFLIILFLLFPFCFGQNPYYHTIDKTSGLPSNSVYDIFQDSKGFMWFATSKGISKYDGSKFTSYSSPEQSSIAGSTISEDKFGRIWYCNFDGFLYYVENGKLLPLNQPETIGYYKYGIIGNLLYLIQKKKILIYDLKSLKPISTHKIEGDNIFFTFADDQKFYVLADFFYEFQGTKTVKKYLIPDNLKKNYTSAIIQKSNDGLIIISKFQKKYYLFQNGIFTEKPFAKELDYIQNISFTKQENWICSTNGIYRNFFSQDKNEVKHYFSDSNISSIFRDNSGYFWISTLNKGLILVEDFNSQMIAMNSRPILFDVYKENLLISAEKDELYQISKNDFSPKKIYSGNNNHFVSHLFADGNSETVYFTSSLFKILNLRTKKLSEIQLAVKDIKRIDEKYLSFSASGMNGIFPVNQNLKSDWDSVYQNSKKEKRNFSEITFLQKSNGKSTTYNPYNQTIYYATNVGLFVKTKQNLSEILLNGKRLYISKLTTYNDEVFALSSNETIYRISKNNEISVFQMPENIQKENISKLKIIENTLYLFGEKTLFEYDLKNNYFRKILYSNDFDISDIAVFDGKNIFATSKGLLILDKTKSNTVTIPKFIINQISANEKTLTSEQLKTLNSNENNIKISFSVLSFVPTQNTEILYRINGKNWQNLEKDNRELVLNSLSFGDYTIDFKTKTEDQFSKIQSISFSIAKPFWLQVWFIIFTTLLFLGLVYLYYRSRIHKIRKQNQMVLEKMELEKTLNESKLKAIKSQMNPHFFYNALNTIQAFILSNEKKMAVNYLSKFSLLTRTILDMTEKEDLSISEEIKTLTLYLEIEKARFNNDFEYQILCNKDLENENPKIPSMLLQPYVENAIKHGLLHKKGEKKLTISFEKETDFILIKIDDNGIGRKKSGELNFIKTKTHKSFATDALQKRIDILNINKIKKIKLYYDDKENNTGNSLGTTVTIEIPSSPNPSERGA